MLLITTKLFHIKPPLTFPILHLLPHHITLNPIKTLITPPPKMSWQCKNCTFLNPKTLSSPKPTCQICLSSPPQSPSSSSSSASKWACKACTFLNPYKRSSCEVCDTRAPISSFEDLSDDNGDELDDQVGSVFLPLQKCKRKRVEEDVGSGNGFKGRRVQDPVEFAEKITVSDPVQVAKDSATLNAFRGVKVSDKKKINVTESTSSVESAKDDAKFSLFRGVKVSDKKVTVSESSSSGSSGMGSNTLKVLTYNVWFREDLEMHKRMKAIGDLVLQHCPDVICFQEVTPDIYDIFQQSNWWKMYQCSIPNQMAISQPYFCMQLSKLQVKAFSCRPFSYSAMGRELCVTQVEVQGDKHLVVATSHLESPCPGPPKWDQMYSKERVDQAKEALNFLKKNPNVIFCGDMNWDDKLDGQVPLPDNWIDAWVELRPGEDGLTYDTKSNQMLSGNRSLRKRLDRFFCCLHDFRVSKIEMIGTKAIPGLSYIKEKKVKGEIKKLELPVLPSDHYGLLLTICGQ
ncbi:uncharacterized protein LOC133729920 isoform X1 [Rosa rugosa]|uniref:uncharacterized protein LOC133729920 isoform X1 n=1 Tax=Rosa rugosa TaxID=74645 RepID=UPI002B412EB0|nr:uncharacterized protein LOC133729920 isoform X1 [Rosa rugosa]